MRPLCKYAATHLGPDKGRSVYLLQLFPNSPAKRLAKIAGLPKPKIAFSSLLKYLGGDGMAKQIGEKPVFTPSK